MPTVLDDRQRLTRLHPRGFALLVREVAGWVRRPARVWGAIRLGLGHPDAVGPALMAAGSLAIVVMIVLLFIYEGVTGLWLMIFSPVSVAMVSTILLAGTGAAWGFGRLKVRAALATLARRRCASCDYDLSGTGVDEDGLVHCPECDAAWRPDRLGLTPPPERAVVVVGPLGESS